MGTFHLISCIGDPYMSREGSRDKINIVPLLGRFDPGSVRESLERNKRHAETITRILATYRHLTDSYIIEFFTDNLWGSLPESWRAVLSDLSAPQLANQLLADTNPAQVCYSSVWPLSLLALKVASHSLALGRTPRYERTGGHRERPAEFQYNHCQSSLLDPMFRKHVKPKKQHEIRQLSKLVRGLCDATRCQEVLDVGSGQGHLSRVLAFGLGLNVTAVEADRHLVNMAAKFDREILYMMKKEKIRLEKISGLDVSGPCFPRPPRHVLAHVDPQAPWEVFVHQLSDNAEESGLQIPGVNNMAASLHDCSPGGVRSPEPPHNISGGIRGGRRILLSGLHACGDLSVAMLRHFARCPQIVGITSVGCCYMKLSTLEVPHPPGVWSADSGIREFGYPMSSWVSGLPGHKLSYKSREVACHAIEEFTQRLTGDTDILKTHCYRAVLETIIRSVDPARKRAGVQTIKKAHNLPFTEYARQGLERVGLDPDTPLDEAAVGQMLSQQQNVVVFFSLALLLAPLVETLILLDRMIFLQEQGQCSGGIQGIIP
ncbi:methyltransferase-like protein 25B [Pyxicephalus adspersus]|uniref:methyltransferase-like protein 25B n=1 Tax=Pyxicephalus adspersus TaxID=30357 RepID=UPI003B5A96BD